MAKYRVKSKEGELVFGSFGEVERAWLQGLVEPDDEVLEEGSTRWRRAGSIPLLAKARRYGNQVWGGTQNLWIFFAIVLISLDFYLLLRGHVLMAIWLGVATAMILVRVMVNAHKKTKPHR
jgi:hypothetical protein